MPRGCYMKQTLQNRFPRRWLLLAFVLRYDDMVAIPKAVSFDHVEENAQAANIHLTEEDLEELSVSFPAPTEKIPMEKY